ncbi:RTA1 like protein [Sarocladium implicatum]|nr:RTA1 like protein [Sarocladium implicatum]
MGAAEDYVEGFVCTLETCSVKEWGYVHYRPSVAGNCLYLAIMAVLAAAHVYLGWRYKIKSFAIMMTLGLVTETLGYVSRYLMNGNPFNRDYFLWYLITLTIGPVFIAAAIYLTIGRIVVVYGASISRILPRTYTTFFLGCDIVSLVVQAAGGGIAASYPVTNQYMIDVGTNILVAGLSIQVASLFFFLACSLEFLHRVSKRPEMRNPEFIDLAGSKRFKTFLIVLFAAAIFLFIRTVFRAVELSEGFAGDMANNQVLFMILDGAMVILSVLCLTIMHPGRAFANRWNEAVFFFRPNKKNRRDRNLAAAQDNIESGSGGSDKTGPEMATTKL